MYTTGISLLVAPDADDALLMSGDDDDDVEPFPSESDVLSPPDDRPISAPLIQKYLSGERCVGGEGGS